MASYSPIAPATPNNGPAHRGRQVRASHMSPSVMSSPGDTIDGASLPSTPSAVTQPTFNGVLGRRRGKTVSCIQDSHLLGHAIFSLGRSVPETNDGRRELFAMLNDEQEQEQAILAGEIEANHKINELKHETPLIINGAHYHVDAEVVSATSENRSDEQINEGISEEDEKDLARHGMPSACVFVANLAATQSDDQLMRSLQLHFGKFGRLHVKIRRDGNGNPYSFCQFESDENARLAVREGRNAIIDSSGRRIRCEPAKVNRTLVLSKHDSSTFDGREAQKVLFGFGKTESLEFASGVYTLPMRGVTVGKRCFVRFAFRQDAVDCYQYFRFHSTWTADWTSNFSAPTIVPRIQAIDIDPVSIFVGKLNPDCVTEEEVRSRFSKYGVILECNLVNKPAKSGLGRNAFAFIKYDNEDSATKCMENENGERFLGQSIHVQKRELHKKTIRSTPPGPRLGVPGMPQMGGINGQNSGPSYTFTLKEVTDLAAHMSHMSFQMADQRRQSAVSMISGPTALSPMSLFPGHGPIASRRGSYQSTAPVVFNQPFQVPPQFTGYNHQPLVPEVPLSPRARVGVTQGEAGNSFYQQASPIHNQSQQNYSPFTGGFPPNSMHHHQFPSSAHLMPPPVGPMIDFSHHRDSIASIGYDPHGLYAPHYSGYAAQPGTPTGPAGPHDHPV